MTDQPDQEAREAEALPERPAIAVTPEYAELLSLRAAALWGKAADLQDAAAMASARSEIIYQVLGSRAELGSAEDQAAAAFDRVVAAEEACKPKAAELSWVDGELAKLDIQKGPVSAQVEAIMRRNALSEVRERLAETVADLAGEVSRAQTEAENHEIDAVAHFRREVEAAEEALESPPIWDLDSLKDLAPETTINVVLRQGLVRLVSEPEGTRGAALAVFQTWLMLGRFGQDIIVRTIAAKCDPKTRQGLMRALHPVALPAYEAQGRVTGPGAASTGSILGMSNGADISFTAGITDAPGQLPGRSV